MGRQIAAASRDLPGQVWIELHLTWKGGSVHRLGSFPTRETEGSQTSERTRNHIRYFIRYMY